VKNRVRQIRGYQALLKSSITLDRTGSEVTLDLKTAQAIVLLLDELVARVEKADKERFQ